MAPAIPVRITRLIVLTAVVALYAGAAPRPLLAQCELAKLLADDGVAKDYFGYAVATSGNRAVIGAYGDDDNGANSGSAYVFHFDGSSWVPQAKLLPDDGEAFDFFGWSVAICDDLVVVGAPDDDDAGEDAGAAYVFRFDGANWAQQAKLLADDGAAEDDFGYSVAVSGSAALVGAPDDDDNGDRCGSAYVFRFSDPSWIQEQKLLALDGVAFDYFGYSVAMSGSNALIGAYGDDEHGSSSGSAYVFAYDGESWGLQAKLMAADGQGFDYFGCSVALAGDAAAIGASGDDDNGGAAGSAYVFRLVDTAWVQEDKLLAADGEAGDQFGLAVAISGSGAIVGAPSDDDSGDSSGSAYVFGLENLDWVQQAKLLAADGVASDWFGRSVAITGDTGAVGAYGDDDRGGSSGSVYVFDLAGGPDCNANGICDSRDILDGRCPDTNDNGIPDDCECPGDLNGDWAVGLSDLAELIGHYGITSGAVYTDGDMDLDGDVQLNDLAALVSFYGATCP